MLAIDTNTLAYSGLALTPAQQAARVRRFGWWYQAEWRLRGMRAYWTSVVGTAVITPLLYVVALIHVILRIIQTADVSWKDFTL